MPYKKEIMARDSSYKNENAIGIFNKKKQLSI